jgi:hypothetical protein
MKQIIMTPEWVLQKLTDSSYADGDGKISFYTSSLTNVFFIELALDTLNISYEFIEFYDDNDEVVCGFEFRIEYIQVECPTLYKTMKELDLSNFMHKNSTKN